MTYWYSSNRFRYFTGKKIDIDLWNEKLQKAKNRGGRSDLSTLNSYLEKLRQYLIAVENDLESRGEEVTNIKLKRGIDSLRGRDSFSRKHKYLVDYGYDIIKRYKDMGKYTTAINSTLLLVKEYNNKITFDSVDLGFHNGMVSHMKNKGYSKNYIAKVIQVIKMLMNLATTEGYTKSIKWQAKQFTAAKEKVYNIYLTTEELEILHTHDYSKTPYLDNACDLFLLGAFTGLRFKDYADLKGVNFTDGDFIIQDTMKVDSRIVIPQHRIVKQILKKRKGDLPHRISNVKMNLYLKEVGEIAGINELVIKTRTQGTEKIRKTYKKWQLITTHTARRSLATNMYLAGVPIKTIMIMTGHSSVKQLMEYIKITEVEVAQSLKDHPFFK